MPELKRFASLRALRERGGDGGQALGKSEPARSAGAKKMSAQSPNAKRSQWAAKNQGDGRMKRGNLIFIRENWGWKRGRRVEPSARASVKREKPLAKAGGAERQNGIQKRSGGLQKRVLHGGEARAAGSSMSQSDQGHARGEAPGDQRAGDRAKRELPSGGAAKARGLLRAGGKPKAGAREKGGGALAVEGTRRLPLVARLGSGGPAERDKPGAQKRAGFEKKAWRSRGRRGIHEESIARNEG